MSKISGQFQDICEISGISGQLGALCIAVSNVAANPQRASVPITTMLYLTLAVMLHMSNKQ